MLLFVIAAFFGALGQYLYKAGADRTTDAPSSYVLNPMLLGGKKLWKESHPNGGMK